jgi:predicted Rossmann fold flavoprotein
MVACEDETEDEDARFVNSKNLEVKKLGVVKKAEIPSDNAVGVASSEKKKKKNKNSKSVYEGFGEMLFTHFGISGPLILTASTRYEEGTRYKIHLNLKPALTKEQLDKRIIRDFEEGNKKVFRNVLGGLFPSKLIPVMINLSGIAPDKKVSEISKAERMKLVDLTQDLVMTVTGTRGFNEAIVTKGGVNVKEIDSSTMESKFRKGLYFAGEVLDIDAVTGGFNLQVAWSTGHLAGLCAAMEE